MQQRKIAFRAWDKDEKRMFQVSPVHFEEFMGWQDDDFQEACGWKYVLMQYTGLKDKNGKEIYESDRVRYRVGGAAASEHIGTVQWFDYYWGVEKEFGFGLLQDVEVVGNEYEGDNCIRLNPAPKH